MTADSGEQEAHDDLPDRILSALREQHGGSLDQAVRDLFAPGEARRKTLPEPRREADNARQALRAIDRRRILEDDSKVLSRISAALDGDLRRLTVLREFAAQSDQPDA